MVTDPRIDVRGNPAATGPPAAVVRPEADHAMNVWPGQLTDADHREIDFSIHVARSAGIEFVRVLDGELSGRGRHRAAGVR